MQKVKRYLLRLDNLALMTGVLIALQARVNGELSNQLGNTVQAAFISFSSGLVIILVIAIFNSSIKLGIRRLFQAFKDRKLHWWEFFGGALGGNLIAIQTLIIPKIGVAVFSVGSIAGQTFTSLLVDKLGISGGDKRAITLRRTVAAVITVSAVIISVADRIQIQSVSLLIVALAVLAGSIIGFQRALNGKINAYSNQSFATSLINFVMGTAILGIYLIVRTVLGIEELSPLELNPWWMYTGGVIGVVYIAFAATVVQHLGVLTFTLYSVGGQLLGSVFLDWLVPTNGIGISFYLITGIAMTYLGVFAGGVRNSQARKDLK
jgi:transporter family-2 protein